MNNEVKTRIDKIQNGEVPQGYKKTKVGIVPSEWEVKKLGGELSEYRSLSNDIQNMRVYSSSRKGLVSQSDYFDKKEAVTTNLGYKIVPNGYVTYRHMSDDDVFKFNINNIGVNILVSAEYPVFKAKGTSDLNYMIPCINELERFRYFCRTQKLGGTRTRLYFKNLCEYIIPIPPLHEQQKIAEILTTQDKVIELKEKLIAEKEQQKKYLMQNLLTGKKRLKGFSGEWKKVKLGEITKSYSGGTPKTENKQYYLGNIPFIRSAEIDKKSTELFISKQGLDDSSAKEVMVGDLLYALYGANSGECAISKQKGAINQAILCIRSSEHIKYLYYFLVNSKMSIINTYLQGGQGNLSSQIIKEIKLFLPPLDEQNAIAEILSTADKEIELLKAGLAEEKQKKKALMQLLLTGIVRVES